MGHGVFDVKLNPVSIAILRISQLRSGSHEDDPTNDSSHRSHRQDIGRRDSRLLCLGRREICEVQILDHSGGDQVSAFHPQIVYKGYSKRNLVREVRDATLVAICREEPVLLIQEESEILRRKCAHSVG